MSMAWQPVKGKIVYPDEVCEESRLAESAEYQSNPIDPARGIMIGAAISAVIWGMVAAVVWVVWAGGKRWGVW